MLKSFARLVVPCALLYAAADASAQDVLEVLPVQGNVYMIAGSGGNTTVQIGPEAIVVVDTKTTAGTWKSWMASLLTNSAHSFVK